MILFVNEFWISFICDKADESGLLFFPNAGLGSILGAKWEAKGAQMPPKIDLKIDEISSAFFDGILIAKWRQ